MNEKDIEAVGEALGRLCAPHPCPVEKMPIDETVVTVPAECLRRAVDGLRETFEIDHLSTITGQDTGEEIELLYHFWRGYGITLRVRLPYADPRAPSLVAAIPGALFYEREIIEMLGVTFDGHPDPQPLLLPDTWEGGWPLRKSTAADSGDEEKARE